MKQGRSETLVLWVLGPLAVAVLLAFILTETIPFRLNTPGGWRYTNPGRVRAINRILHLLLGLVVYTGSFIAEIVRAGIQAVPKGQWEAARALGLKPGRDADGDLAASAAGDYSTLDKSVSQPS